MIGGSRFLLALTELSNELRKVGTGGWVTIIYVCGCCLQVVTV